MRRNSYPQRHPSGPDSPASFVRVSIPLCFVKSPRILRYISLDALTTLQQLTNASDDAPIMSSCSCTIQREWLRSDEDGVAPARGVPCGHLCLREFKLRYKSRHEVRRCLGISACCGAPYGRGKSPCRRSLHTDHLPPAGDNCTAFVLADAMAPNNDDV